MSETHNADLQGCATSDLRRARLVGTLFGMILRDDDLKDHLIDMLRQTRPDVLDLAQRRSDEADAREAEREAERAERQRQYYAENPHLHPDAIAERKKAQAARAAWWNEGTRAEDALKAALEDVERRPVPAGGLCLWVDGDGIASAGLNPRDALRRAAREYLDGWHKSALSGEFEPEEDAIDYLATSIYEGGPVFISGEPHVVDMLLRSNFWCNGTSMPEVADELEARGREREIRPTDVTAEANLAHWTPEARRAAVDRFWAETWPELADQVDEHLQGPVLWINDGGFLHVGWTAREAFRAAVEDAVQGWNESAAEGEVGPDEGPEVWARGEAAGWPLRLDGPTEMQVALLRGSGSAQCRAFAEELKVSAEMAQTR